ncbi:hypothetical protein STRDD11_02034 [Streptococcus sp. DD11]|nr:hypothetical protein STRDD11_02034 [Streptococcus sp. DD11]
MTLPSGSFICHLKTSTGAFEQLAVLSSCVLSDWLKLSPGQFHC